MLVFCTDFVPMDAAASISVLSGAAAAGRRSGPHPAGAARRPHHVPGGAAGPLQRRPEPARPGQGAEPFRGAAPPRRYVNGHNKIRTYII